MITKLVWMLAENVRQQGWRLTAEACAAVIADLAFDWRYGTNTWGWINPDELPSDNVAKLEMTRYAPTRAKALRKLLRRLAIPPETLFIDIGCGKGRAMLIAATSGFREVIGVEGVPEFAEQTTRNVEVFRKHLPADSDIRVICCDAADYAFPHRDSVLYLFDPFTERVLTKVLDHLRLSMERSSHRVWMIFADLQYPEAVKRARIFTDAEIHSYGGHRFTVFSNRPSRFEPVREADLKPTSRIRALVYRRSARHGPTVSM